MDSFITVRNRGAELLELTGIQKAKEASALQSAPHVPSLKRF
jgi:hypothetical protein